VSVSIEGSIAYAASPGEGGGAPLLRLLDLTGWECAEVQTLPLPCDGQGKVSLARGNGRHLGGLIIGCGSPDAPLFRLSRDAAGAKTAPIINSVPSNNDRTRSGTEMRIWVGLPLLSLDEGYLRVSADSRSNRRRLDLWSSDGEYVRSRIVDTAMGLFASSPEHQLLLGLRNENGLEVVVYRWSWSNS
jgi:hypothetical protein